MNRHHFWRRPAQTMVEYAILLGLIALGVILVLNLLGGTISATYNDTANQVGSGSSGGPGGGGPGGGSGNPAEFTVITPLPAAVGDPVQFDGPTGAADYDWDFDGDGITDDTVEDPSFTYSSPGTYTVNLAINGGADSFQYAVEITDVMTDTFDRVVAAGFGTASSGKVYSGGTGDAYLSVDGDRGVMHATDIERVTVSLGEIEADWDDTVEFEFEFTHTIDAAASEDWGMAQWEFGCGPSSSNEAMVTGMEINLDGTRGVDSYGFYINGEGTAPYDFGFGYVDGETYHVKGIVEGNRLQAKIWPASGAEPGSWTLTDNGDPNTPRWEELDTCWFRQYGYDWATGVGTLQLNNLDVQVTEVEIP